MIDGADLCLNESELNSTPRDNTDELLKNFNTAKATYGCGGARRSAFPPDVLAEINQYLAQQPERSSLSSVGVIPASLSASESSALVKKAVDAAEVIEQRRMRQLVNEMRQMSCTNVTCWSKWSTTDACWSHNEVFGW